MKPCPCCGEQIQEAARKCRFCGELVDGDTWERPPQKKSSNATTWIIIAAVGGGLVVILIAALPVIAIMMALLLPATQQAREAARRSTCKNNMKQIGLALHNYHEVYGSFPPAYIPDENGKPMHSWRVLILPFLDQMPLYDQYDFSQPWDSAANQQLLGNMPPVYACPSHSDSGINTTHYAAVAGPGCIFNGSEATRFRDVTDGLSNTLAIGEVEGTAIPWTKPEDVDITISPVIGDVGGFTSSHAGGVHFLLGDGSVRFVSEYIQQQTLHNLYTRDGGEIVGEF